MRTSLIVVLVCVVEFASCYDWKKYEGYRLVTSEPTSEEQVRYLADLQHGSNLDFWDEPRRPGKKVAVFASPSQINNLKTDLSGHGITYNIEDYDITNVLYDEWTRLSAQDHMNYNYSDFNPYQTIMDEVDVLASQCHPDITCTVSVLGQSPEGRDIKMLKMSKGGSQAVWIDSEIHAREWLAAATTMNIVRKLITEYGTADSDANILAAYDWYYVPVMNPDGYEYTWNEARMWRKNRNPNEGSSCIGTDLNRNYDFNWGAPGASSSPCSDTYRGPSSASEVETQAIQNQVLSIQDDIIAFWSVHTHGEYLLAPLGDCTLPPPAIWNDISEVTNATCKAIEDTFETEWQCGNSCEVLYETSGTTSDWAYGAAGIKYSWTPELRGMNGDFIPPASEIPYSVEEIWAGVVTMMRKIMEKSL